MGRPSHHPDAMLRRQVEAMSGFGVPEAGIAGVIGIDPKTLRKHYRAELDQGHVKANMRVAENLYRKATGEGREAVIAAIFWLKTRAGWRETSVHEIAAHNPLILEAADSVREKLRRFLDRIAEQNRMEGDLVEALPSQGDAGSPPG